MLENQALKNESKHSQLFAWSFRHKPTKMMTGIEHTLQQSIQVKTLFYFIVNMII